MKRLSPRPKGPPPVRRGRRSEVFPGEMNKARILKRLRVGLQLKSAMILALVVFLATACGAWFYFDTARDSLRAEDHRRAFRVGQALGLAAQQDLRARRYERLHRLVRESLRNDNIQYVGLLNARGEMVASASQGRRPPELGELMRVPVAARTTRRTGPDRLMLAYPVVLRDVVMWKDHLAGSIRLILDTSATTARLKGVRRRMYLIAMVIVVCAFPLGYALVWQVILRPMRKLVSAARRLGRGDLEARAALDRHDEIGHLAGAFDRMAGKVQSMHVELLEANEALEKKVAARTRELRIANQRLRAEMAEKEDFLRAVSHDLNAPLRNIAGMVTLIMMKWRNRIPEELLARLQRIQANVDAETELLTELLELSRIRTRPQRRETVDMIPLIREVAGTFDFELKNREISLTITRPMPRLRVEKNRIRQVFQNLIDNAIKYIGRPGGGRIVVGYEFVDGCHQFSVADNGPGIAGDQKEGIFQVFRRGPGSADGEVAGKGVGLALVRTVSANYEGRAWVESRVGAGSIFYFSLSAATTDPENTAEQPVDAAEQAV